MSLELMKQRSGLAGKFAELFGGDDPLRVEAFGTGRGEWVKRPLRIADIEAHLGGEDAGIGLPPLRQDSTVYFAAIDLDEPNFEAAREMQGFLPGETFIERSRSGNAHIWAFFREPLEAWVAMGLMKEAVLAAGLKQVEVFPKNHDFTKVTLGNYINLPYHGEDRAIFYNAVEQDRDHTMPFEQFLSIAGGARQDPEEWRKRARWLMIAPPEARTESSEFGKQPTLHICTEHILANCEENPVVEGSRNAVFFALAKGLSNYEGFDHTEALDLMKEVNSASPDPLPLTEIVRILSNAERGEYTSTDCDNPLVTPYCHPDCPILRSL